MPMSTSEAQLQVRKDLFLLQLWEKGEAKREFNVMEARRWQGRPLRRCFQAASLPAALLPET